MSDMKDTNAVVNSEPMDQSGDTSMPSAQQQVIFWTSSEDYMFIQKAIFYSCILVNGATRKVGLCDWHDQLVVVNIKNILLWLMRRNNQSRRSLED
jgi:hypothetical protein